MTDFALIGVGGYVAPLHMKAINETGGCLVAAIDKHDSVGIMDSYFPNTEFFTEFYRFDRYIDLLQNDSTRKSVEYVSICSPNNLHDSHIKFALRSEADAICEKPTVLNPWHVASLSEMEKETGKRIFTILQLRLHPTIKLLSEKVVKSSTDNLHEVEINYITARGRWYLHSWKGSEEKSGGIATNLGIHLFDMLIQVFGKVNNCIIHTRESNRVAGTLELEKAKVRWFLSIDELDLPAATRLRSLRIFRSILIDGEELDFSTGFNDLHTESYKEILAGRGFGLEDVYNSINLTSLIRTCKIDGWDTDSLNWRKNISNLD
ncbi:MAG: UDP-N-acetyl-2-amino-2-deoxyglucuronate dehydrogenase [Planctomycetota bacterium]|jgi:UDP-N-acetyl-2-amino-2-deoxyglucuronate dehydrogenase